MYIDEATMENSVDIPQNLKMEWPYDIAISLLGIYPEKNYNSEGYRHIYIPSSTIYNS